MKSLARTPALVAAMFAGLLALPSLSVAQELTITHAQGETTITGIPGTVLTSDWAAFDNLHAMGIPVAGVPASNVPTYLADFVAPDVLKIGSLFEPDFEAIAATDADLYIVAARSQKAYDTARDIVPTIDMSVDNADIIAGIKANLTTLGAIFQRQDEASDLNAALDAKVAEVKAAAAGKGNALVLVTNAGKVGVYGPDSRVAWIHDQLGIPTAMPNVQDGDHGGDGISFEFILETNPDWLFVVDRDAGTGESAGAAAALLDNELVNQTKAATAGHIVYLDPQAAYITMHGYSGVMLLLDQVLAGLNG